MCACVREKPSKGNVDIVLSLCSRCWVWYPRVISVRQRNIGRSHTDSRIKLWTHRESQNFQHSLCLVSQGITARLKQAWDRNGMDKKMTRDLKPWNKGSHNLGKSYVVPVFIPLSFDILLISHRAFPVGLSFVSKVCLKNIGSCFLLVWLEICKRMKRDPNVRRS